MKRLYLFLLCLSLFLATGCRECDLTFHIRFNAISGLTKEAPVLFDGNRIGKVTGLRYTEKGNYIVDVSIEPNFRQAATTNSSYFIAPQQGTKLQAVHIVQQQPGGTPVKVDATVEGTEPVGFLNGLLQELTDKTGAYQQQFEHSIEELQHSLESTANGLNRALTENLDEISRQLRRYSDEISKIPSQQEIDRLKESFNQLAEELQHAQSDIRRHITEDILPQLQRELNELRKRLKSRGDTKGLEEIEQLQKQLNAIQYA